MSARRRTTLAAAIAVIGLSGFIAAGATAAPTPGQKVADFTLPDQNKVAHHLFALSDAKAVVLITQGDGCPVVRNDAIAYNALKAKYAPKGVDFFMLNSNIQDSPNEIVKEAADFNYNFPILLDQKQQVGAQLHVERTAEVIVIDPKTWKIVFSGPIDDRVTYERQKASATKTFAATALDQFLAGKKVADPSEPSPGCLINFPT